MNSPAVAHSTLVDIQVTACCTAETGSYWSIEGISQSGQSASVWGTEGPNRTQKHSRTENAVWAQEKFTGSYEIARKP